MKMINSSQFGPPLLFDAWRGWKPEAVRAGGELVCECMHIVMIFVHCCVHVCVCASESPIASYSKPAREVLV